jgi:hypothetical protein
VVGQGVDDTASKPEVFLTPNDLVMTTIDIRWITLPPSELRRIDKFCSDEYLKVRHTRFL